MTFVFIAGCALQQPKAPERQPEAPKPQVAAKDDFGCFYSCKYFPEGFPRQMCEDWKAGKEVQWPSDCKMMQYSPCIQLCEAEKKAGRGGGLQQEFPTTKDGFNYPAANEQRDTGIPKEDLGAEDIYIYITDHKNNRIIRMEDMTGKGWVSFGTKGNGVGQFFEPTEIAVDKMGRIYITDWGNHRIVRIDDMTGNGWVSYGTPLRAPFGIDLDLKDRIYVTDGTRIVRIDNMNGDGLTTFGAPGSGVDQFNGIKYLEIDSQERIYVGDKCSYRIVRINDMTGNGWTALQSEGMGPLDSTCGGVGKTLSGSGVGQFNNEIGGLEIDSSGRIYIADEHNDRIIRVDDMNGGGWVEFKGVGSDSLTLPHDISMSKSGKIYIADTMNNRIVRVDDMNGAGWISFAPYTVFYSKGAHQWQMEAPKGIFIVEK